MAHHRVKDTLDPSALSFILVVYRTIRFGPVTSPHPILTAMSLNSSSVADADRALSFCQMCRGIVSHGGRWYRWVASEDSSVKNAIYIHYQNIQTLRSSRDHGCRTCELICLSFENLGEEYAKLEKLVQDLQSRNTRRIDFGFRVYDADDSKQLPQNLDADGCFDDEESALLSLTSACGDGTIVLIDRPGPPRWLDVRVLSRAYGHLSGVSLQIQTDRKFIDTRCSAIQDVLGLENTPASDYVNISTNLMDRALIQRIGRWMARCSLEHNICRHMISDHSLPTRVIEICGSRKVRVMETRGMKAPYSCLSYCWGSKADEVQALTTARRDGYTSEVPWRVLPNTVAGAIQLARELGFVFIWIDAFCIIQDDPDDWLNEAGKMADIYGHSSLTITTPQSDGASGDFTVRQNALSMSIEVSGSNLGMGSTLMLRPRQDCTAMFKRDTSPWMKRGWTLQEWLLSPRVLHCGAMAIWDCFETARYEDRTEDHPQLYGIYDLRPHRQAQFANRMFGRLRRLGIASGQGPIIEHGSNFAHWNQLWSELVEDFTARKLTDPKDKLPALAGIAQQYMTDEYAEGHSPEYLAGIWRYHSDAPGDSGYYRSEFPAGLLWRRQRGSPYMVQPPPSYRAPSWSWAALDGPVMFMRDEARGPFFHEELCLDIHDAACEYRPRGSISSVASGSIVADGPLKRTWLTNMGDDGQTEEVALATDDLPGLENQGTWMAVFDQAPDQQAEMYLLRVITKSKPRHGQPMVIHWALVLKPRRSGGDIEAFVRLGVAMYQMVRDPSKWSESRDKWTSSHLYQNWQRKKVVMI